MGGHFPIPKHDKPESNTAICVLVMEHERGTATMEHTLHQGWCPTSQLISHQWSHIGCKQRSAAKGLSQWRDWSTNPKFGTLNIIRLLWASPPTVVCGHTQGQAPGGGVRVCTWEGGGGVGGWAGAM